MLKIGPPSVLAEHVGDHGVVTRPDLIDTPELRKARGAFFTPAPLARFLVEWGVQSPTDAVLEPSCGEAAFLLEAGSRLATLNGSPPDASQLIGVDLHEESVRRADHLLAENGFDGTLTAGDFFAFTGDHVDAVLGNPPFIRYQDFAGSARAAATQAALASGVRLSSLASSWAHFTVHATSFLRTGGRMGLVLPAELLSANYAGPVRQFLMERFSGLSMVLFTERVFPGVQEEVVLLMASGYTPHGPGTDHFEVRQVASLADLDHASTPSPPRWSPAVKSSKWTTAIGQSSSYTRAMTSDAVVELGDWGRIALGIVSGRNKYFALSDTDRTQWNIPDTDVRRLSPPGSKHLRRLLMDSDDLDELASADKATWLFSPGPRPSAGSRRYIAHGEDAGVDSAYKCRIRSPWWQVPLQRPADLLITCMNADTAALCANPTGVLHLNSVHGLYLTEEVQDLPAELLALAACSTLTRLGAEIVGRSYGGGLLKLEPREAAILPVPSPTIIRAHQNELSGLIQQARGLLAAGRRDDVQRLVDALLAPALGLDEHDLTEMSALATTLHARRRARGTRERA